MSADNGILTHQVKHKASGDILYKGSKAECKLFLKGGYSPEGWVNFEIEEVPFSGNTPPLIKTTNEPLPTDYQPAKPADTAQPNAQ